MSEELKINKQQDEEAIYKQLLPQIESLLDDSLPVISNLANLSAALKEAFDKISWVGFYLNRNNKLYLGPFQGKTACTTIEFGKGVCGTAAAKKMTVIVDDVNLFPGHIACDSASRSEIVVPLISGNRTLGVLDIDSYLYSAFNSVDEHYLELIAKMLIDKCNFNNLILS